MRPEARGRKTSKKPQFSEKKLENFVSSLIFWIRIVSTMRVSFLHNHEKAFLIVEEGSRHFSMT